MSGRTWPRYPLEVRVPASSSSRRLAAMASYFPSHPLLRADDPAAFAPTTAASPLPAPPSADHAPAGSPQDAEMMQWIEALKAWEDVKDRREADRARRSAVAEVRRLGPHGVPAELRALVWQKLLDVDRFRAPGMLDNLLARPPLPIYDQIEKDIGRTYPNHVLFKDPTSPGQLQLANVLKAYAQHNPALGYTQGMNFICGLLLLHMPPEEALCTLVALMETRQFPHQDPDLHHLHAACAVFDSLVARFLPEIHARLATQGFSAVTYLPRWWMSGWEVCPWGCRVRAWDCVVVEGYLAFHKVSLAILACIADHLAQTHESEVLDVLLHPMPRDLLPDCLTREYLKLAALDDAVLAKAQARVEASESSDAASTASTSLVSRWLSGWGRRA
ncbi:hypothetical protein H9P43_006368 [Blastocladiella emersonii ATCC 22665]|nr:hypothetical protein H9P43_006368 [Blastocladiella emersonii ATCC 22665]